MEKAIRHLIAHDPVLRQIVETHGHPVPQLREDGFAAMAHIILEQQVSVASAKATYQKLILAFEEITPEKVLEMPDEAFRACGVSRQKTSYIKDLAERVLSGEIDFATLPQLPEEEIRTALLKIKGVGNWSVEVYLLFCLQAEDIIPLGDIAIINTIKELWPDINKEEIPALAETWKPYRTAATYLLWHHYVKKRSK